MKLRRRISVRDRPVTARRFVHQPLDEIGRLGAPGAAIGVGRHGVGEDALADGVDGADVVEAGQHGEADRRDVRPELVEVGAHDWRSARPASPGRGRRRRARRRRVVTLSRPCASARKCSLRSDTHLHRPAERLRRLHGQRVFAVVEALGAKAAADVGRERRASSSGRSSAPCTWRRAGRARPASRR